MKPCLITLALLLSIATAHADSLIVSQNGLPIEVTLQECDKDGYSEIRKIGTGTEVVVPSSAIAAFRGNAERGVYPAVLLGVRLATPVKNKFSGDDEDGATSIVIPDGRKIGYRFDLKTQHKYVDYNLGEYP